MADSAGVCVADLMARDLPTVSSATPAFDVARRMAHEKLRHVLVESDGQLVGLVDRAALLRHLVAHYRAPDGRPIGEFVLHNPVTIGPRASAFEAIQTMRRHRIGSLPVLDGKKLVGLVSERRLMAVVHSVLTQATPAPPPALWETST